jgi:hypothetical protein
VHCKAVPEGKGLKRALVGPEHTIVIGAGAGAAATALTPTGSSLSASARARAGAAASAANTLSTPFPTNSMAGPDSSALEVLDLLGSIEMFSNLGIARGLELVQAAKRVYYRAGQTLIEEGTVGSTMFVVAMVRASPLLPPLS